MITRATALWLTLALLGIAVAAALTWSVQKVAGERIGLASAPLSLVRGLAPHTVAAPVAQPTVTVTRTVTVAHTVTTPAITPPVPKSTPSPAAPPTTTTPTVVRTPTAGATQTPTATVPTRSHTGDGGDDSGGSGRGNTSGRRDD